jgi:hypothetical protein
MDLPRTLRNKSERGKTNGITQNKMVRLGNRRYQEDMEDLVRNQKGKAVGKQKRMKTL